MKETISISIEEAVVEDLNDHLSYGDSRSEWVEDAILEKLERERLGDGADEGNASGPPTAHS